MEELEKLTLQLTNKKLGTFESESYTWIESEVRFCPMGQ